MDDREEGESDSTGSFPNQSPHMGQCSEKLNKGVVLSEHCLSEAVTLRLPTLVYPPHRLLLVLWYKTLLLIGTEELSDFDCF